MRHKAVKPGPLSLKTCQNAGALCLRFVRSTPYTIMNTDQQSPNPSNRPGDLPAERIEEVPSTAQPLPVWPATQDTYRTNTPPATETTGPATAPPAALRELKIADIVMDAGTQIRVALNEGTIIEYSERMLAGDKFPPADVFFDGKGYYLADGFHRVLAAKRANLSVFACNVHPGAADRGLWFALAANRRNGLQRTTADKQRAIELAFNKFPEKTQQQIAEQVGCSQQYVAKIQNQLTTSCKLKLPAVRRGQDKKAYRTKRKPRANKATAGKATESASAATTSPSTTSTQPSASKADTLPDRVRTAFRQWMEQWAAADLPRVRNIVRELLKE